MSEKLLSVIIPVKNKLNMTAVCIASLVANTPSIGEVIVIDDHSDETKDIFTHDGLITVYENKGHGVNSAWNFGASLAIYPYIAWVNNDILFSPNWEKPLIEALDDETWLVSPYHTAGELPKDFPQGKDRKNNMSGNETGISFLGSCYMMKKENWERIGPIDRRLKMWCGDNYIFESIINDFGRKVREIPESYIHHFISQTINRKQKSEVFKEDMKMFNTIYGERNWGNSKIHPWIPQSIDLRLKLPTKSLHMMEVLNVGAGDGWSGLARQLPYFKYNSLVHIDVHMPYLQECMKLPWDFNHIAFRLKDVRFMNFIYFDLVMIFDVLEHLPKKDAIEVINKIKESGVKLLIFGPLENRLHNHRLKEEVESQEHLSLWTEQDFKDLGLKTEVIKDFHIEDNEKFDAIWAWNY